MDSNPQISQISQILATATTEFTWMNRINRIAIRHRLSYGGQAATAKFRQIVKIDENDERRVD